MRDFLITAAGVAVGIVVGVPIVTFILLMLFGALIFGI